LLYTAQKSDVESVFTEQGFQVVNVSISTDPFTGRNPSYCFVDLDTAAEAQRAIAELNGVEVLGRGMRVSPGVARRNQGQTAQGDAAAGVNGREVRVRNFEKGSLHREERSGEYKPSFDQWNRTDASSHWQAPQSEGRRLYVGNLPRIEPQSALDEEIQSLFSTHLGNEGIVPAAVSKLISPHPSKASEPGNHYYCFVDLDKAEDADVVIAALDGKQGSWGGNLRINKAREQNARKVTREQGLPREGLPREGSERKPFGGRWRTQE
jgi:RNA recognition motif-containing protein